MNHFKRTLQIFALIGVAAVASDVYAAPEFVDREITLPRHDWAFDIGLGFAHDGRVPDPAPSLNGVGMNFDMAVAVTHAIELGFRSGVRFNGNFNDGTRTLHADEYGRIFDRQTLPTGDDLFANPEFRITGALLKGEIFELALEGRATLPFETGTRFGAMFGVPMHIHAGNVVRIDTGAYIPTVFGRTFYLGLSVPADVWIQVSEKLWLGPMLDLRFYHNAYPFMSGPLPANDRTDIELGFGLGYSITSAIDFKTNVIFPSINQPEGARWFGIGGTFEFRIE